MPYETFNSAELLSAFRDLNLNARKMAQSVGDDDSQEYLEAAAKLARAASGAADKALAANKALDDGDDIPARQYLDRMAHVMGMISAATHYV